MIFCAAGDIHGALDRLYDEVMAFEATLAVRFAWVLHVGDFGVWPDPDRIDKATRSHDGAGDFPRWLVAGTRAPRRTAFIKGNHEDFVWLDAQPKAEVLPGLFYLRNGATLDLDDDDGTVLRAGGIGGCFGRSDYERKGRLQGYGKRHYTREEIERLSTVRGIDIMLMHDAPAGVRFEHHRQGPGWVSDAAGLDDLLASTDPRVCFFGHHHQRLDGDVSGVRCVGLNKVGRPGNLVAVEITAGRRDWTILGEWPR